MEGKRWGGEIGGDREAPVIASLSEGVEIKGRT
jgi:hypothetical protein